MKFEVSDLLFAGFPKFAMRALSPQYGIEFFYEFGKDYYWDNEAHDVQKKWFIRQLNLAREMNLPVIIHSREAAADGGRTCQTRGRKGRLSRAPASPASYICLIRRKTVILHPQHFIHYYIYT